MTSPLSKPADCNEAAKMRVRIARKRGPSWIRDLFCVFVEAYYDGLIEDDWSELLTDDFLEENDVWNKEVLAMSPAERGRWLTGKLWHCTSIMPGSVCNVLDMRSGSTYAMGARKLREMLPTPALPEVAERDEADVPVHNRCRARAS